MMQMKTNTYPSNTRATIQLDIQYNKIAEWLLSRNQLPTQWVQLRKGIQYTIKRSYEDKPTLGDEIDAFLIDNENSWNYRKATQLLNLLSKTDEFNNKNFFGQHSMPFINTWKQILKNFKKSNLYLADLEQALIQYVKYDIPHYVKMAAHLNKQVIEMRKRQHDLRTQELEANEQFTKFCNQFDFLEDMEYRAVPDAIRCYTKTRLESLYNEFTKLSKTLFTDIITVYEGFLQFIGSKYNKQECVRYWRYFVEHGNVRVYEAADEEEWIKVNCGITDMQIEAMKAAGKQFEGNDIKFEIEVEADEVIEEMKNNCLVSEENIMKMDASPIVGEGEISWDVEIEDNFDIQTEEPTTLNDTHFDLLLSNSQYRALLCNDILEMYAFVCERLRETLPSYSDASIDMKKSNVQHRSSDTKELHAALSILPDKLILTAEQLKEYKHQFIKLLDMLNGNESVTLFHLQSDPRHSERLMHQYSRLKCAHKKPQKGILKIERRIKDAENEIETSNKLCKQIRHEVKEIKMIIENDIGALFGADIQLTGEIERVLL